MALLVLCSCAGCAGGETASDRQGTVVAESSAQFGEGERVARADRLPVGPLDTLRGILRTQNPAISRVAFREIQSIDYGRYYFAIGWGVRADMNFRGSFEDELFVILRIDSSLTRIAEVLELIPSPRWLDYKFTIDAITGDSLIVVGKGDTYGDGPQRRAYRRSRAQ